MEKNYWRESYVYCPRVSVLRPLRRLLDTWTKLVARYVDRVDGDVPYWYGERANVSLLAGAAWTLGGLALEEFSETKFDSIEDD